MGRFWDGDGEAGALPGPCSASSEQSGASSGVPALAVPPSPEQRGWRHKVVHSRRGVWRLEPPCSHGSQSRWPEAWLGMQSLVRWTPAFAWLKLRGEGGRAKRSCLPWEDAGRNLFGRLFMCVWIGARKVAHVTRAAACPSPQLLLRAGVLANPGDAWAPPHRCCSSLPTRARIGTLTPAPG